jgi:hypothetical protein
MRNHAAYAIYEHLLGPNRRRIRRKRQRPRHDAGVFMERMTGIEPATFTLATTWSSLLRIRFGFLKFGTLSVRVCW